MLHKLKLKKKLKKIIVFLVAVIIAFSCFIFTVSALDEQLFYIAFAQPTVSPQNAYVEIYYKTGSNPYAVQTIYVNSSSSDGIYLSVNDNEVLIYNRIENDNKLSAFYVNTYNTASFVNASEDMLRFNNFGQIYGFKAFGFADVGNYLDVTFNVNWSVVYGEEQIAYQQRETIYYLLREILSDNSAANAITSQTGQLLQQQQQTTQQIIQNQQEQTDKILNGGHDSPSYEDFSSNPTNDEYENKESYLNDRAEQGVEDYNAWGTAINNMFGSPDNSLYKGVSAMSVIIARLTGVEDWVYNLLIIALYFGLFGYVVNSLPSIIRSREHNSNGKNKNP